MQALRGRAWYTLFVVVKNPWKSVDLLYSSTLAMLMHIYIYWRTSSDIHRIIQQPGYPRTDFEHFEFISLFKLATALSSYKMQKWLLWLYFFVWHLNCIFTTNHIGMKIAIANSLIVLNFRYLSCLLFAPHRHWPPKQEDFPGRCKTCYHI